MQNQFGRNNQADKGESQDNRDKTEVGQISVIGADITITGNIEASVDLHIEGRVNGDVRCQTLILGENSVIEGSITCERVRVSGAVQGSVHTRDLAIEATARVAGDVSYERLRVANGGAIEGNIKRRQPDEPAVGETGKLKLVEGLAAPAAPAADADGKPAAVFIE